MACFARMKCDKCDAQYEEGSPCACTVCGGSIQIQYDYEAISKSVSKNGLAAREAGVWKYAEFLPLPRTARITTLGEGGTRLVKSERLGQAVGLKKLFLKDETRNPTGSFKDRCSTVSISKALEAAADGVVIASSGGAAASACAYSTVAEIPCYVFVPSETSVGRLLKIRMFGGRVSKVVGPVENCMLVAEQASRKHGWINVTTNSKANPYTIEGTKTAAYEISEALGWRCPDYLALPVGSGACLLGHWRGFRDLEEMAFVSDMPRLVAVQAEGCAPLASAMKAGLGPERVRLWSNPRTIASGISDAFPADVEGAYEAIRHTSGLAETVSDDEIAEAQSLLARKEGIFAEPTGAVSIAGAIKLARLRTIDTNDVVVCEITGHGLNDIEPTLSRFTEVSRIQPVLEDFERSLMTRRDA